MIVNPSSLDGFYKCNRTIMEYLVYKCRLPIFTYTGDGSFYFIKTDELDECVKKIPLKIKILSVLRK